MEKNYLIGCPSAGFSENKVIYFRKQFTANKGSSLKLKAFADAQYKLYINGSFADAGPAKGNDKELYYNELDLSKYLIDGTNEIEFRVLNLRSYGEKPQYLFVTSLRRSGTAVLEVTGTLNNEPFVTDETWDCAVEDGIEFFAPTYAYHTGMQEHIDGKKYKKVKWEKAVMLTKAPKLDWGETTPWHNVKSPIPLMKLDKKSMELKVNKTFDFGYITTAYLKLAISGKGKLTLTYAEKYKNENEDRADKNGAFEGDSDIIEVDGEVIFEPYRFRCFRFIKLEAIGDIKIKEAAAYETGYPIEIKDDYDFGNDTDNKLWEISRRTLERCMQDTFTDCPYYEQLQYSMDTYLQQIFAYQVSGDDRLQRRAIKDFAMSINAEGLAQSRTPSVRNQFIPCFSLYYIMMVLEHFERFGDESLFEENLPYILEVLNWYKRHCNADGLVVRSEYWHFIDWAQNYMPSRGVPPYEENATLGIESLMLSYVLKRLAGNLKETDYAAMADVFIKRADKINKAANEKYYCEKTGAYSSTENKKIFGQHMQIWAVLSECATGERAKSIMKKSFEFKGSLVTFAYMYFLFRALEKTDLYNMRKIALDELRRLTTLNCTTIPETPVNSRSECHAWGAVALYEFTAMDLGVKQCKNKIVIKPYTEDRDYAKGTVNTSLGEVYIEWKKENDRVILEYKAPEGAEVIYESN